MPIVTISLGYKWVCGTRLAVFQILIDKVKDMDDNVFGGHELALLRIRHS